MARELVIYTDESISVGSKFSDFYGGLLVESTDLEPVITRLEAKRASLGLRSEVKWARIDRENADRYIELMDDLFALVQEGRIKIRIMFTQNTRPGRAKAPARTSETFFKLYYQFIKHAFGLRYAGRDSADTRIRLMLDQLPDTSEQAHQSRGFVSALSHSREFRGARIFVDPAQIAEV